MTEPSPQSWTIRLKAYKTTVLLHVDPLQTFSTIKDQLYDVLKQTGISDPGTGKKLSLPSSSSGIQLGRPVNMHDASEGFYLGQWEYPAREEEGDSSKDKSKGKARARKTVNDDLKDIKSCPKGVGLRDGAVLAFRWVGDGTWEGEDEDMEFELGRHEKEKGPNMWSVQLATFEDVYGVENETDVGARGEFEG